MHFLQENSETIGLETLTHMLHDPRLMLIFTARRGLGWGHENVVSNQLIKV